MSYVKIDTDLGGVLHRQYSSTCLHTLCIGFCGVSGVDLGGVEKVQTFTAQSRDTPLLRLGYS